MDYWLSDIRALRLSEDGRPDREGQPAFQNIPAGQDVPSGQDILDARILLDEITRMAAFAVDEAPVESEKEALTDIHSAAVQAGQLLSGKEARPTGAPPG